MNTEPPYRGRFAPSPTGPLHLGSLVAAVASYLDARAHHGTWLVRIEDLDPPREDPQAKDLILQCLLDHGMQWDEEPVFQSARSFYYEKNLEQLNRLGLTYRCPCSRQSLDRNQGAHQANCPLPDDNPGIAFAIRLKSKNRCFQWQDQLQGSQEHRIKEDVVLKRKDQLFAYQLAVVSDDHLQQITHVIRGADLIDSTPIQLCLYQALGYTPPRFGHVPIVTGENGQKLSKQNHAPALDSKHASDNLIQALSLLGITLPAGQFSPQQRLSQALERWPARQCSKTLEISIHRLDNSVITPRSGPHQQQD